MYLTDWQIKERCVGRLTQSMIEPFTPSQIRYKEQRRINESPEKIISYGLSSRGYDARLDNVFLKPRFDMDIHDGFADPKDTQVSDYDQVILNKIILPPGRFILGQTIEYFRIPKDILGVCFNKSTYARCGILINVTPLEPGWEGQLTVEISNTHEKPVVIYAGEGICQILFDKGEECEISYADRGGKYMGQIEPTVAKV